MEPTNLTIEILKGIRDEVKGVREEVKSVRDEVKGVREEVKGVRNEVRVTNERVDAIREQQVHSEIRVATELLAVGAELRGSRDDLRLAGLRARLDDHEARIEALENRTD
jgi:predicted  nucleic acid-binding Zn-ribbon protein